MKIVVIGGTGLIGSKVVEKLKQKGHEAVAAAPNTGVIHADRHGAVVVPVDKIDAMHAALDGLMDREARILAAARAPDVTVDRIKAAFRGA